MNNGTNTSFKSLFNGITSMLNTIKTQNPDHKSDIGEIISMCDEAMKNQSFAKISYMMKDLSVDVDQKYLENKDSMQRKYKIFIMELNKQNSDLYTPGQKKLILELTQLSDSNKVNPSNIFSVIAELASDMSVSMSAYRKETYGDKEIGNNEYTKGIETVMAADVATAGKRITRDLKRLSMQLKDTGSTDPDVIKILNEIDKSSKGEIKFYEAIDLLSKVTWLLCRLNDKSLNREKEYLVNISTQFSEMSKSCIKSMQISDDSGNELKKFDDGFLKEIEAISTSSKNAQSLDDLKVAIAIHVEKMQDKLSRHMLNQSVMIKKQKTTIEKQVENIEQLNEKVETQQNKIHEISVESGLDQLTRLPNRRSYDEYITNAREEYVSKGTPVSLMLLDIDHFKKVNDNYGHASGDIVLRDFSKILTHVVGNVEGLFAARYGGEEFAIIGKGIQKKRFVNIGKKIKDYIEKKSFKVSNKRKINSTVSIGVSFFNRKDDLADNVFESADKALYQAKDSGRNQLWISNKTLMIKSEENDM